MAVWNALKASPLTYCVGRWRSLTQGGGSFEAATERCFRTPLFGHKEPVTDRKKCELKIPESIDWLMHTNGGCEAIWIPLLTKVWLGILWGRVRFGRICQSCIAEAVSAAADWTYHHSVCALLISQQKPWNQLNTLYRWPHVTWRKQNCYVKTFAFSPPFQNVHVNTHAPLVV